MCFSLALVACCCAVWLLLWFWFLCLCSICISAWREALPSSSCTCANAWGSTVRPRGKARLRSLLAPTTAIGILIWFICCLLLFFIEAGLRRCFILAAGGWTKQACCLALFPPCSTMR